MKSVAISVLTLFAGFCFAGVPTLCLVEDFLRESGGAARVCLMIGGANVPGSAVSAADPASATRTVPVFGVTGPDCHQRIAESPNTSNSAAAMAPIKYCRRYRPADTG